MEGKKVTETLKKIGLFFPLEKSKPGWPINIRFRYLEDVYEESIVIVLETIPYNDNIGLKKLESLLAIFSEN